MNGLLLNDPVNVSAGSGPLIWVNEADEVLADDRFCFFFKMICEDGVGEDEAEVGIEEDPICRAS